MSESPRCPEHGWVGTAACLTCGREVCPLCLRGTEPAGFACPGCGETGAALYDEDPQAASAEDA